MFRYFVSNVWAGALADPLLVLQAVGGVEKLEIELQGQGVGLRQVAEWLQAMQASSTAITARLVQVSLQLDHLQGTVEQRFDDVDSTLQAVLAYITAKPAPLQQRQQQQPKPAFVIPRSELRYTEADLEQAAGGAFGRVVKAARDQGYVALKIYRHRGLGKKDRTRVVQEALLLARASHQNVVRCFGVVYDPDRANHPSNIDGSLVMEWVYGGDLYQWLQDNDSSSFRERLLLATQVGLLGGAMLRWGWTCMLAAHSCTTKVFVGAWFLFLAGRRELMSFSNRHSRHSLNTLSAADSPLR
jgi:hypothetical protein